MAFFTTFKQAPLAEKLQDIKGGNRGYYVIFPVTLGEEITREALEDKLLSDDQFVLIIFDVGAYKERELDEVALRGIRKVLYFFLEKKTKMMVRACYDREGKAMEKEPQSVSLIVTHYRQVLSAMQDYWDYIFLFQGMLVGNWGEMHGSRFLSYRDLSTLYHVFEENAPASAYLVLRRPVYCRMLLRESKIYDSRLGLFNDGILGSETDYGTYAATDTSDAEWEAAWSVQKEMAFQKKLCQRVPNGGEVIRGDGYGSQQQPEEIIRQFYQMHLTYLNRQHDRELLRMFEHQPCRQKGPWYDRSLYEFVGAHLGYRFIVVSARMYKPPFQEEMQMKVSIKNTGFAPCYERTMLRFWLKPATAAGAERELCVISEEDRMGLVPSQEEREFCSEEFVLSEKGSYEVYLEGFITAASGQKKEPLVFANQGNGNRVFLGIINV